MKRLNWLGAPGLALLTGMLCLAPGGARADGVVTGHVLVKLKADQDLTGIDADYDTVEEDAVPAIGVVSLKTPAGESDSYFALTLSTDPRVKWAETDTYVDSPEVQGGQFHVAFDAGPSAGAYTNQYAYLQVHFGRAAKSATGKGVIVAILDTGATYDHPALKAHYLPGCSEIQPGASAAEVPDGSTDVAMGHGTMVAGIIARMAPAAKLLPVRVLNADGIGTALTVAKGLAYAVASGAGVINMSLGTSTPSDTLAAAVTEASDAGAILVASAGNDNTVLPHYPAAYDSVLGVASFEANGAKSPYSNYGDYISLVAPGTGIRSTYYTGGYANWSGTSFAAPFISGEAALVLSRQSGMQAGSVSDLLTSTAVPLDNVGSSYSELLGDGIIDVEAAVRAVR